MDHLGFIELMGEWGDALGVAVIVLGVVWGMVRFPLDLSRQGVDYAYKMVRNQITRTLLLGLEVLVAADIIRTVATNTQYQLGRLLGPCTSQTQNQTSQL